MKNVLTHRIPFHRPFFSPEEAQAVREAFEAGTIVGNGPVGRRVEAVLRAELDVPHALLTTSCTAAMELAWMVLGLGPGDEVLLPSFTFVSCATSVMRVGATPVFVDIDPVTLTIDPEDVARKVTPRCRAILPVHYGGTPCAMEAIGDIAARHRLRIVEDAAQAIGASLDGRQLGTLGDIGCISFHGTKNVTSGEGGVFVTSNGELASRALLMREKGTNRRAFLEGQVDEYTWVERGGSFELSDLLAAVLLVQLSRLKTIQRARRRIAERYLEGLAPLVERGSLSVPARFPHATPNWHVFYVLLPSHDERDRVMRTLARDGIDTAFHFVPLHSSPFAQAHFGYEPGDLPVTEDVARRLLRLPIYPDLAPDDQDRVIASLTQLLT